jgi:hypothetical protein
MTILEKLQRIQLELKAPKNQRNNFGKYNYRSAEDILEAIKPYEEKYKVVFKINDKLVQLGDHVCVDSEAKIIDIESIDRESSVSSTAQAIIDFQSKGMQMPQRTGAASSYAKKYALGNLLLLDDTKDSDATNNHSKSNKTVLTQTSSEFDKVKKYLKDGGSMEAVEARYTMSKQVKQILIK